MNGLLRISVPQTNRNKTRLSMLARKVPSSRFEIAAPIWRAEIKTPLENKALNKWLVNVAAWRSFSKRVYKIYSFAGLAIGV